MTLTSYGSRRQVVVVCQERSDWPRQYRQFFATGDFRRFRDNCRGTLVSVFLRERAFYLFPKLAIAIVTFRDVQTIELLFLQ